VSGDKFFKVGCAGMTERNSVVAGGIDTILDTRLGQYVVGGTDSNGNGPLTPAWPPFIVSSKNSYLEMNQAQMSTYGTAGASPPQMGSGSGPVFGVREFFDGVTTFIMIQNTSTSAVQITLRVRDDFATAISPASYANGLGTAVSKHVEAPSSMCTGAVGSGNDLMSARSALLTRQLELMPTRLASNPRVREALRKSLVCDDRRDLYCGLQPTALAGVINSGRTDVSEMEIMEDVC